MPKTEIKPEPDVKTVSVTLDQHTQGSELSDAFIRAHLGKLTHRDIYAAGLETFRKRLRELGGVSPRRRQA